MWLTRLAVGNPVAVFTLSMVILVLAAISGRRLPIDMFPSLNIPCIQINTNYAGASPEEVERSITLPLEQAVSRVGGIVRVSSTSSVGRSQIQVWFKWGQSLDASLVQIISNVQRAMRLLPPGVESPAVSQFDVSNFPVVQIAMDAPTLSPREQYDLCENTLAPQLARLPGVSEVQVRGGVVRQLNVNCDPQKLQARGITLQDVEQALRLNNRLIPSGVLQNEHLDYQLEVPTLLRSVDDIAQVIVATRQGVPIKVRDVADVIDGEAPRTDIYRVDGKDNVALWVLMQPQANLVQLSDAVTATVPKLVGVPEGVELRIIFDQSNYIRTAVQGLVHEGLTGAVLVAIVVLLFLRNWTSVIIICIGIPLAVAAALICLYFTGQSLNVFTLGGLTLALGRLVDDAIVVRENITRHLDEDPNSDVSQAVLRATGEVGMPVLASTLTTVAVFFPVVFLEGISQKLFVPLSLTIIYAMMASYFVSMSVDPVLSIAWMRRRPPAVPGRLERLYQGLEDLYERALRFCLRRRFLTSALLLVSLLSALMLAPRVATEFFPESDEGVVTITVRTQLGTGVPATAEVCREVDKRVREKLKPGELLAIITSAGSPGNQARLFVRLCPAAQRKRHVLAISAELRKALSDKFPGVRIIVSPGGLAKRILNFGAEAPIDVQIQGFDQDVAMRLAMEAERLVKAVPGATDVQINPQGQVPSFHISIDRDRAALLGLNPTQVATTINTAIAGGISGSNRFIDPVTGNEFNLATQLQERYRTHPEDLGAVPVVALFNGANNRGAGNQASTPLMLRDVAKISLGSAPLQILHKNQVRVIDITANTSRPLGEVSAGVREALQGLRMPEGFTWTLAGQTAAQEGAFSSMALAAALALLLIYAIMTCQFGTLWEPMVIMSTVPLGLIGVCWAQLLTNTPFSVMSFMGVIMMTGIVVSNGILLVEFARHLQEGGMDASKAVVTAARTRLRPILMTAIATIVGMIPMATGWGGGSETNQPLARAVVGGLTVSTVLTLVVVPLVYIWMERLVHRSEGKGRS